MTRRNEQAAAIWPHLAADRPAPRETPRQTSPLAQAMYPSLAPPRFDSAAQTKRDLAALNAYLRELNARRKR
jgi:hypothetical protein